MSPADPGAWPSLTPLLVLVAVPLLIVIGTSFAKLAVVLHAVRLGLGAPDFPPTLVITALAAALSLVIMAPVMNELVTAAALLPTLPAPADPLGLATTRELFAALTPPLERFLLHNAAADELAFFRDLAGQAAGQADGLPVLLAAFAVTELVEGLVVAFLVLLPFLAVDLIVANTLAALGLETLPLATVALPIKLLLFLAVDGLHLVIAGLAAGYAA